MFGIYFNPTDTFNQDECDEQIEMNGHSVKNSPALMPSRNLQCFDQELIW